MLMANGERCFSPIEVINPATDKVFAAVARASIEDADAAMAAARRCVNSGALTNVRPAKRTAWMLKAAEAIRGESLKRVH